MSARELECQISALQTLMWTASAQEGSAPGGQHQHQHRRGQNQAVSTNISTGEVSTKRSAPASAQERSVPGGQHQHPHRKGQHQAVSTNKARQPEIQPKTGDHRQRESDAAVVSVICVAEHFKYTDLVSYQKRRKKGVCVKV